MNITEIKTVERLEDTPAKVNRYSGKTIISKAHFRELTEAGRVFVTIHEQGHMVLKTIDEIKADNFAIDYMLPKGYSLKEIFLAAYSLLDKSNPVHILRLKNIFNRLAKFDLINNNNKKMKNYITKEDPNQERWNEVNRVETANAFCNFSLIPKFMQKNMDSWNDRRDTITEAKAGKIEAKGQAAIIEAGGGGTGSEGGGFLEKAGGFVGGLLGNKTGAENIPSEVPQQKNNTTTYIVIAVVVILAVVGAIIYFRKKKK